MRRCTRASVPGSGIVACRVNHLSMTSGSLACARKKVSRACSRTSPGMRASAPRAAISSVMLLAV